MQNISDRWAVIGTLGPCEERSTICLGRHVDGNIYGFVLNQRRLVGVHKVVWVSVLVVGVIPMSLVLGVKSHDV